MKSVSYLLTGFAGAVLAILASYLSLPFLPERVTPVSVSFGPRMEYTDFLTVMFAAATVVLAALAIFVGLAAIFTYQGIKDEARRTIENEVEEKSKQLDSQINSYIQQALEKAGREGKLDDAIQRALVAIYSGLSTLNREIDEDLDDNEER